MTPYDPSQDKTSSIWALHQLHQHLQECRDWHREELLQQLADDPELRLPESRRLPGVNKLKKNLTATELLTLPDALKDLGVGRHITFDSDTRRYTRRMERDRRRQAAIAALQNSMKIDFLNVDLLYQQLKLGNLLPTKRYTELKVRFVRKWALETLNLPLDDEQAGALAVTAGNTGIRARAGSGKTRVLTTRALFLVLHCRIKPSEMMLLAFNRDAAEEMKSLLHLHLGENIPYVMTFHALAHALVQPEETLISDDTRAGHDGISREVSLTIKDLLRSDEYGSSVKGIMKHYCSADWDYIETGGYCLPVHEYLSYRRSLKSESLKGDYVKSFGEKVIANILFEYGVRYHYEKSYLWNGVRYRPDFTIERDDGPTIVIEYFGMAGDPAYDEQIREKQKHWRERDGFELLEYYPKDVAHGEVPFRRHLLTDLSRYGMSFSKLTEAEIFKQSEKRWISDLATVTASFIGRCRQRVIGVDEVEMSSGAAERTSVESQFLDIAAIAYSQYLKRLQTQKLEDFSGLMQRAAVNVGKGETQFVRDKGRERGDVSRIRFLLIDEFQDFSRLFWDLIAAIRKINSEVTLFCVGDDWQAINGFAGSDSVYLQDFNSSFENARTLELTTNYRSSSRIVEVGNAIMSGRGTPAGSSSDLPGDVAVCVLDDFEPSVFECDMHGNDFVTPAVLRIVGFELARANPVVLLSRTNRHPWHNSRTPGPNAGIGSMEDFVRHLHTFLPQFQHDMLLSSTVHSFKGLEREAVILVDGMTDRYPLFHPHWVFERFFGVAPSSICDDERRLFYVGVTRAVKSLYILTEQGFESPFLLDVDRQQRLRRLNWPELASVVMSNDDRIEIRIHESRFEDNDLLKARGFRWRHTHQYWHGLVPREEAELEQWAHEPWHRDRVWVEAWCGTGQLLWSTGTRRGARAAWRHSDGRRWRLAR